MTTNDSKVKIEKTRLSFPSLFKHETYEGVSTNKYAATFIIPKTDVKTINNIKIALRKLANDHKIPSNLLTSDERCCFRDGDLTDKEELQGSYYIKAKSGKRVQVFDKDKTPIDSSESERFYSGCYVSAVIDFWYSTRVGNKRVCANLYGVQFLSDGVPLGGSSSDVSEYFGVEDSNDYDDDETPF